MSSLEHPFIPQVTYTPWQHVVALNLHANTTTIPPPRSRFLGALRGLTSNLTLVDLLLPTIDNVPVSQLSSVVDGRPEQLLSR